ncbi:MAG: hypothetical protein SWN10_10700 [Pseudomonadota bacterium]|nr:hypothetical protein [Pseudomonadota bacterium]
MNTKLLTYGNSEFFINNAKNLCQSALSVGFDSTILITENELKQDSFWKENSTILNSVRGGGYWLWKPFIIKSVLERCKNDEILVYSDAGKNSYYKFKKFPKSLVEKVKKNKTGYLLGPALFQHGPLRNWTKRDCLKLMDTDRDEIFDRPLIQATWSLWRPTKDSFEFLDQWLQYSKDPRCLTDIDNTLGYDNYDGYVDHRHDQSIVTLLAYSLNSEFLDFSSTGLFEILSKRPQSSISHNFLKRIDDAENLLTGKSAIRSLLESFITYKLK